jgi:hypothetical protein
VRYITGLGLTAAIPMFRVQSCRFIVPEIEGSCRIFFCLPKELPNVELGAFAKLVDGPALGYRLGVTAPGQAAEGRFVFWGGATAVAARESSFSLTIRSKGSRIVLIR